MAKLVADAAAEAKSGYVRIQFDPIAMPHGKLAFGIAAVRSARGRVPSPHLVRIEAIELLRQIPGCELHQVANKVSVDVVGMIFILHERAVGEDFADANLPKLAGENLQSADKLLAPSGIPSRIGILLSAAAREPL